MFCIMEVNVGFEGKVKDLIFVPLQSFMVFSVRHDPSSRGVSYARLQ